LSYLDSATTARLERLRESDSIGLYASDEPSEGNDPDNALTVVIDPTLRVTAVHVHLVDKVRQPSALADAVKAAYAAAMAARLPKRESTERSSRAPRSVASAAPVTIVPGQVRAEMLDRHRIRRESKLVAAAPFGFGEATGISGNECVTVTLPPASSSGAVSADPGWLQNASAANLAKAVAEAFTDAYQRRDQR